MERAKLELCLSHLDQAERLMDASGDLASRARLALVIDLLRQANGLPQRALADEDGGFPATAVE